MAIGPVDPIGPIHSVGAIHPIGLYSVGSIHSRFALLSQFRCYDGLDLLHREFFQGLARPVLVLLIVRRLWLADIWGKAQIRALTLPQPSGASAGKLGKPKACFQDSPATGRVGCATPAQ